MDMVFNWDSDSSHSSAVEVPLASGQPTQNSRKQYLWPPKLCRKRFRFPCGSGRSQSSWNVDESIADMSLLESRDLSLQIFSPSSNWIRTQQKPSFRAIK